VPGFQYPQFCSLARAAEIIGERWTLLILRELFFGPQRFSDLRRRLSGVSPSVLSERLGYLESLEIIRRTELEPPAASTVYELCEHGRAFGPALATLASWGSRFLLPPRADEQLDPDRFLFILTQAARRAASPDVRCELRMPVGDKQMIVHVAGGPDGTCVSQPSESAEDSQSSHVLLSGQPLDLVGLIVGSLDADEAVASGRVRIEGDASKLVLLAQLFEIDAAAPPSISAEQQPSSEGEQAR
jgi:DNA-binding HxlR family transcriptional regulator